MSANPSPLSSLTSSSGGVMPQGEEVASFATYPEAQRAVDALSDQGFPVQHLAIIGTDLRQVERITGRMSWGRAAMSGAMSGLWIGVFFGLIMSVAGSNGPRLNFWACVLLGVLWGIVFQLFSYALTRGRRDFTSISQVVASRYSIIAAREVREAAQALADVPGNLSRGGEAQRRSQERRRAREETSGPTAFGSRPDEQPRFGVRLPQPGSTPPDVSPASTPVPSSGSPTVPEDYDPFRRPSRRERQEESGGSTRSQDSGGEPGSGDDE
ncbi:general stress protein [Actinomyces naeslundii]|uniref:general stress protein n=1 Tax=Actinomyces naeslundii TaxID=1655 RepID=UPI0028EA2F37|nr:general stress protein [Actinomyces naeslundii]